MSWQVALLLLVVINSGTQILVKTASDKLPTKKSKGVFYQYLFCAALASGYFFVSGPKIEPNVFWVGLLGFGQAFGAYLQWRTFGFSLSKTILFLPLMDVVTITLAVLLLAEIALWNFQLIVGVILCFLGLWMFKFAEKLKQDRETNVAIMPAGKNWFLFTISMILIFGTAGFLVKFFSSSVPRESFVAGWYLGAFLATPFMLALEKAHPFKEISKRTVLYCFAVGAAILGNLFILYWAYQLGGPVSMMLPIKGVVGTVIPVLAGLFLFKERNKLSRLEWLAFVPATIGAILIVLR